MKSTIPKLLLTALLASCIVPQNSELGGKQASVGTTNGRKNSPKQEAFQHLLENAQVSSNEEFFVYSPGSGKMYRLGYENSFRSVRVNLDEIFQTILNDLQQQADNGTLAAENPYFLIHNHPSRSTDLCNEFKVTNRSQQRSAGSQQLEKILCSELGGGYLTLPSVNFYDPLNQAEDADIEASLAVHALWEEPPGIGVTITHRVMGKAGYLDLQVNGSVSAVDALFLLPAKYRGWFRTVIDNFTKEQGKTKETAKSYLDQKAQELSEKTAGRLAMSFNSYFAEKKK